MHLVHGPFVSAACVFSTSTEGNTPKGVPHRVQGNVDAAESPSDGLMPQSHLAPFTSFHGAAHHICIRPERGSPRLNTGTGEMTPRGAGILLCHVNTAPEPLPPKNKEASDPSACNDMSFLFLCIFC